MVDAEVSGEEGSFEKNLLGTWLFERLEKHDARMEGCPPAIRFDAGGSYVIFSDCYADDLEYPVVEKGSWHFDPDSHKLTMVGREFVADYQFHGDDDPLIGKVKSVSDEQMTICFFRDESCENEVYARTDGE